MSLISYLLKVCNPYPFLIIALLLCRVLFFVGSTIHLQEFVNMKMPPNKIREILECDSLTDDEANEIWGQINYLVNKLIDLE